MTTYTLLVDRIESVPEGVSRMAKWAKATNEIVGLVRGLLADGQLVDSEARYLRDWIRRNQELLNDPLVRSLASRVERIYADDIASPEELDGLRGLLTEFAGGDAAAGKPTSLPLTSPAPDVVFQGRNFCFTGTFVSGKRSWCEEQVLQRAGSICDMVQDHLNYLVIGSKVTASWANQSYGRKIEAAVGLRDGGAPIAIINEDHWLRFL